MLSIRPQPCAGLTLPALFDVTVVRVAYAAWRHKEREIQPLAFGRGNPPEAGALKRMGEERR